MRNGNSIRVRVGVMARAWVGVRIRILYCSSTAQFFLQFYAFHIVQMRNGYGVKITVRVSGYG